MHRNLVCAIVFAGAAALALQAAKRPITLDDLNRLHNVGDPQVSPDGKWVAYTVSTVDKEGDKSGGHVWMVSWDGSENIQLTNSTDSEGAPRWSPDGKYLSFTSGRPGKAKGTQVWVLDRRGGEAQQLTDVKGRLSEYSWSPDSKRLVFIMRESDEPEAENGGAPRTGSAAAPARPPKPIVIDRYHFKQDMQGYLSGTSKGRIYLYDIAAKKLDLLTTDKTWDESGPVWSPDGARIAFVSNHDEDPDRSHNTDVFVVDAKPGSTARRLTTHPGPDGGRLAWSPDSKWIAYTQGSDPKYSAYNLNRLAVVPAAGGEPRVLTAKLDRGVSAPEFTNDGTIIVLVADDRSEYPAKVSLSNGSVERLVPGKLAIMGHSRSGGHEAVLASMDDISGEIYALEGTSLRKLTAQNDALISELQLGETEDISFNSKDGTEVHGLITKPPAYEAGKKYPMLLRIHGGPNGQDQHAFNFERQFFAAHGYVVLNVNYRGSAGRGQKFSESIFADWGNKEVADLLAGVDKVISMGIVDPDRLGIGGWSYGGILTDYTIASDARFKAAISGAGSANQIAMYGVDQYTFQYDNEVGPPWKNQEAWVKISYPFYHADRIRTPTLFMGGDRDFNVPVIGGEQMYQALRSIGIPTELVVYPGQFHGFTRPSFIKDRYERYLAWYDKYLKAGTSPAASTAGQ
ncbi:MAG TPA: S9 family peptidase [Bryobacteraceae bacterium]|nr:S9 family peptidase [Bryobacteraceae bacterium]